MTHVHYIFLCTLYTTDKISTLLLRLSNYFIIHVKRSLFCFTIVLQNKYIFILIAQINFHCCFDKF